MSAPPSEATGRLERLAAHAPSDALDPDALWTRGRRRQRRRWAAAVAVTVVIAGLGAAAAAPLSHLVDPPVAENSGGWVLPDVVRQPGGWEPAFGRVPGRLSAIGSGSRSSWTGPRPAYWAVSAATGESRWLDLPATTSGGFPVLSSDGTALAYWASMGDTGTRTDGRFPAPTELRLLDLTTGDEQRWAPETRHGLSTFGMAWAGDTLWFKAGAYRDAGRNSAEVGLHTWRRGSTARDVSDLHTSQVNLTTATTDARGFLAGAGTASSKTWRGTAAGGLGRLVLDTSGTVSSPAMSPDGRLVAGIRQGRTEQTYGVAGQLLVGEVVDGHARMRPAVPVQTAFVLGWRSPSEVVVMHASAGGDTNGDGVRETSEVWVADLTDPERTGFAPWIAVTATTPPTFAADALTAEVVPAPDAPNAPDPRLFSGGAVILALLLVSGWRFTRGAVATPDGFAEFVRARHAALLRTAYLLTGHAQDAEDLVQTTLVKVVPQWRRIRDNPEPYVRRVMVNENVSRWRRRRWREHSTDELPEVLARDPDVVELMAVRDALATLAPRQRAVLVLRYYEGLSEEEIAREMSISPGTVKSQARDALARLRALLPEDDGAKAMGGELRSRR